MSSSANRTRTLTTLGILTAIILVMTFTPLGYIKTMGLEITLLHIPVILGAALTGPAGGMVLGAVFGFTSFFQCFGLSTFGTTLFSINPAGTFIVCVIPRILLGLVAAYIYRGRLRELLRDPQGAKEDRSIAQRKIAEYRSRLNDSTYSIYADTTQRFDRLLSFDSKFAGGSFDRITGHNGGHEEMRLLPLFKFTLMRPDSVPAAKPYHLQRVDDFKKRIGNEYLTLSCRESNIAPDTLVMLDKQYVQELNASNPAWTVLFERAVTQSLIKQYTNSVSTYSSAIELNPSNPFLYLNRSTTRAEMIDFISSIDNSYQRITIDSDPANRLNNNSKRTYSYDEAVADLNKAVKLFPDFAYAYYNRANLLALSGSLPEAFEDYTKAISLNPAFAEAYYNRGIIQLFMKDTRKGCLDLSKAGELGITEAYEVLKRYASLDN